VLHSVHFWVVVAVVDAVDGMQEQKRKKFRKKIFFK